MRSIWIYASLTLALVPFNGPFVAGEPYALLPRQDNSPKARSTSAVSASARATESTPEASDPTAASDSDAKASSEDAPRAKTDSSSGIRAKATSSLRPALSGTATVGTASATGSALVGNATNGTSNVDPNKLPIHPAITPALSVAGAYLIISGALYTLIGIKTKWLHIFLSAAYLTSLAVTVLIVYVMHPPISNAVQGAYFVAIWFTGIIFGGGSVLFADVTEGLGCLFGGFCLSMWFLVLKPGGLITSTAGRAIFIACFTLGMFGFYLSHYTRPYGLIGSTSFAGATVIVLGVDCFSRAGLKEFWLYIWDLNDGLFPFRYGGPYPITRGIRVEVACIILLFLMGIMSQMKVWKIIKERRDKKLAVQLEEEQRRDQADEDLGRRLEEGNGRDRAVWEAVYGNGDQTKQEADSGLGTDTSASTRKGSLSAVGIREVRDSGSESIELSNLGPLTGSSRKGSHDEIHGHEHPQVTVRLGVEDDLQGVADADVAQIADGANRDLQAPIGISIVGNTASNAKTDTSAEPALNKGKALAKKSPYSKGPKIVPLPFRVPDADPESGDDTSSIATFAASDQPPIGKYHRLSSGDLFGGHVQRDSRNISEEALIVPHVDDDGASSVAATVDGVSTDVEFEDEDVLANAKSLESTQNSSENLPKAAPSGQDSSWEGFNGFGELTALTSDGRAPGAALRGPKNQEPLGDGPSSIEDQAGKLARIPEPLEEGKDATGRNSVASDTSKTRGKQAKLSENLPASTSKVVMAYRTNEWAKHLEAAESPELEDLTAGTGSVGMDLTGKREPAAPVHIKDLQQTPLTAEPATIPSDRLQLQSVGRSLSSTSKNSLVSSKTPLEVAKSRHRGSMPPAERSFSQSSLHNIQSRKESASSTQLKLSSSQTSLTANRGYRSSSTPLANSPLVESPIAEDFETSFPPRFTPSSTNLMSQRDSMVRNRPSSTSLNRMTPSPFPSMASPSNDHLPSHDLSALEEDDIPLSQRKSLLHLRHQQPSRSSLTLPQPQRSPSNPRESTLSAWRSSLRADLPAQQAVDEAIESRRTEMINEKRRTSTGQQWAQLEAGRRESDIDRSMRRGELLDLHREAMRKMQGMANRNL